MQIPAQRCLWLGVWKPKMLPHQWSQKYTTKMLMMIKQCYLEYLLLAPATYILMCSALLVCNRSRTGSFWWHLEHVMASVWTVKTVISNLCMKIIYYVVWCFLYNYIHKVIWCYTYKSDIQDLKTVICLQWQQTSMFSRLFMTTSFQRKIKGQHNEMLLITPCCTGMAQ